MTDLNMPVMDGWTLIDRMKKEYEDKGKMFGINSKKMKSRWGNLIEKFKRETE